jgi:hypothetical protein
MDHLKNNLAEDYAATKAWCDYNHPAAAIEPLRKVDPKISLAFQKNFKPKVVGI